MSSMRNIVQSVKSRYFRREFDWKCKAVLETPPVQLDESSGLVILSQSYHKDLLMFLVAAKTFARFVHPMKFVIVDDGFTPEDRGILRQHLRLVEFIPRKSVSSPSCPTGGCWERLLSIADICGDHYVIQLDSDTVTIADPEKVRSYISNQTSFTLSTKEGRQFISVSSAAADMAGSDSGHIQIVAEKALGVIPELAMDFYIRGCAGFAGFAKGSIDRIAVERVSNLLSQTVGPAAWGKWGSEQFASNYLIANTKVRGTLPFEAYPYWGAGTNLNDAKLLHFIGEYRFASSAYRRIASDAISKL